MAKSPALPLLAGGAALLLLAGGKKKGSASRGRWGVFVSQDCQEVTITDPRLFEEFLAGGFNQLISIDDSLSVIQISDALFGDVAPNCAGFPEKPDSYLVAELYATIVRSVVRLMVIDPRVSISNEDMVDQATRIAFAEWYEEYSNYPSSEVPSTLDSQVAFSSDLSDYEIGPTWYEETVKPFVAEEIKAGRGDSAYEGFVANRGVLVGRFVRPISELPEDKVAVEDFLDKLEASIDKAAGELA